jgi:predicted N-acetyltransferase YhbS
MTVTFTLRNETPADIGAITEVTMAAFESLAISQHTEHLSSRPCARPERSRCRSSPKPGAE